MRVTPLLVTYLKVLVTAWALSSASNSSSSPSPSYASLKFSNKRLAVVDFPWPMHPNNTTILLVSAAGTLKTNLWPIHFKNESVLINELIF